VHYEYPTRRRRCPPAPGTGSQSIVSAHSPSDRLLSVPPPPPSIARALAPIVIFPTARVETTHPTRALGRTKDGRRLPSPPKPYAPPAVPDGKVNLTDPDSRLVKSFRSFVQGYNAQAVVDRSQIVLAAEVTTERADWSQLGPIISATLGEIERAGVSQRPKVALADSQYWNEEHIDQVVANKHIQVLIPPRCLRHRKQPRPGWRGGRYDRMRTVLDSEHGRGLYRRRIQMIEPVFGHTKHNRDVTRFLRRGRSAVRTEWRLLMMTHNLTKLHSHQLATVRA
jgi:Transposase DDE domain